MSGSKRETVHWFPPADGVWPPTRRAAHLVVGRVWGPAFGLRVDGGENLPEGAGALLVVNHLSDVDPPFLAAAYLPRDLLFVGDARHFRRRGFAALLFAVGGFPLSVDKIDTRAIRYARDRLEAGRSVVIFPEGRPTFGHRMLPFHYGMGYLALSRRTLVVPTAIWGTQGIFEGRRLRGRGPVTVRFGPPFRAPADGSRKARARAATERAQDEVAGLVRELAAEDRR